LFAHGVCLFLFVETVG